MNEGERFFCEFCNQRKIQYEKIKASTRFQSPDYRIWIDGSEIIVEVKALLMNDTENVALKSPEVMFYVNSVFRIRNDFDRAKKQFRKYKFSVPIILVLVDLTLWRVDDEDVLNAMYGDEALLLKAANGQLEVSGHVFGKHRKVGPDFNTSISAIARLQRNFDSTEMTIYHNGFAAHPLDPTIARTISARQLRRKTISSNSYGFWEEF